MKQQKGFTLIELIVVIVILGILAATAVPKFASLAKDARIAVLNGAKGSLAGAAAMAHGKYLANSVPPFPPVSVSYEGATVTFATTVASGYPMADAGFAAAAGLTTTDFSIIAAGGGDGVNSPVMGATEMAFIPNSVSGTPDGLTCYVKYAEPLSTTAAPIITVVSGGC